MKRLSSSGPRTQRGAALMVMMLVLLTAMTAVLVSRVSVNSVRNQQLGETGEVLAMAREKLIDYATILPDIAPGQPAKLPCPDIDGSGGWLEGEAHRDACGATGVTVMGRLPWRTLGLTPPKDGSGACLWYVVSGSHKDAATASSPMVNPDTNGQLQVRVIDNDDWLAGAAPEQRPVALVIAPMMSLGGQSRPAPAGADDSCSSGFAAGDFLDADAASGITNAAVSGSPDVVEVFGVFSGRSDDHNDRVAVITRADLARAVESRHDYPDRVRELGLAVAGCIADYARNNPGGTDDKRLPWPAPIRMADYRTDSSYDDAASGILAGRLPDAVDESSTLIGNSITQVLSACDPVAVPQWTPQMQLAWSNWKDHLFYAVAESYAPDAPVPSTCVDCFTVNGGGQAAAIVLFAGPRLGAQGQLRNAPPLDTDTKDDATNYLEAENAANMLYTGGTADFRSGAAAADFNDRLFCIDLSLSVAEC